MIHINTDDSDKVRELLQSLYKPPANSHKGQNGKILIIGGSTLFHSPPLWVAEAASHIVDMVHVSSTYSNNKLFSQLKKNFRNGIIIEQKDIQNYVKEDDVVLIGSGMMRGENEEAKYTARIVRYLFKEFPDKKFVLDAGAIQMMNLEWLENLHVPPILTPHQLEFERLFRTNILTKQRDDKIRLVEEMAQKYKIVLLLKAVIDIISDGKTTYVVEGGNAGLTKGGSGDILAGLAGSFYTHNDAVLSATAASLLLKKSADELYKTKGYWYNMDDVLGQLPQTARTFAL